MIVLAVDTAHAACSACVYDAAAGRVLAEVTEPMRQGHAERLAGMVEQVAASAGITLQQVDRLAACSGPGTFTGVRIGLAFIRGLALVLKVPAVGVTTFEALAAGASVAAPAGDVWVIQDARRSEVYIQGFDCSRVPIGPAEALALDEAQARLAGAQGLATGSGVRLLQLPATLGMGDTSGIPGIAAVARLAATADPAVAPPAPCYLRAADAKAQPPLVRHATVAVSVAGVGPDHAAIIAGIHAAAFEEPWDSNAIADLLSSPGAICLLAASAENLCDQQPLGFVLARKAADEMEILTIAVLPSSRRRGVGKALLDGLCNEARKAGAVSIFIEYATGNSAADALYKAHGFHQTGIRKDYYRRADGTRRDAITAVLKL